MNKWRPVERRSCSDEESYFLQDLYVPPLPNRLCMW